MQTPAETQDTPTNCDSEMPSAEFVRAVSDLLDIDPDDLLAELGYYNRSEETVEAGDK